MNDADTPKSGTGLVYEDRIPVRWQVIPALPARWQMLKTHHSNEQLLRYLAAVDEHRSEGVDEDHGPLAHDIARLEYKLNLLLEMVGRLLGERVHLPEPTTVRMTADELCWIADEAPEPGSWLSVDLFLNQRVPCPVILHGQVDRVRALEDGLETALVYRDISEAERNWIEKLIFRQHRRLVALSRQGG